MYNKDNYYVATKATFRGCKRPRRKPDYISYDRDGDISSEYWYVANGVIRGSEHWSFVNGDDYAVTICGSIATCHWGLKTYKTLKRRYDVGRRYGFCAWKSFKSNKKYLRSFKLNNI